MAFKTPAQIEEAMINGGKGRANQTVLSTLILGFLAGAYIAFGGMLAIRATATMPAEVWGSLSKFVFGGVFPVGLLLVIVGGADLFTGNCVTVPAALYSGNIKAGGLAKSWILSYIGNFIGSVFVAFFLGYLTGLLMEPVKVDGVITAMPWAANAVKIANAKVGLSFGEAFWRAVGCNWLVCLAVWLAASADDIIGKAIAIWFPIMAFVTIGFEHSVANMAFIPMGIFAGNSAAYQALADAPVLKATWSSMFVNNLLPVTLGNIVGGALFVAGLYYMVYYKGKAAPKNVSVGK